MTDEKKIKQIYDDILYLNKTNIKNSILEKLEKKKKIISNNRLLTNNYLSTIVSLYLNNECESINDDFMIKNINELINNDKKQLVVFFNNLNSLKNYTRIKEIEEQNKKILLLVSTTMNNVSKVNFFKALKDYYKNLYIERYINFYSHVNVYENLRIRINLNFLKILTDLNYNLTLGNNALADIIIKKRNNKLINFFAENNLINDDQFLYLFNSKNSDEFKANLEKIKLSKSYISKNSSLSTIKKFKI